MEATGYSRWFERLLAELSFEVWIGDPAEIKAKRISVSVRPKHLPDQNFDHNYFFKLSLQGAGCPTK